MPKPTFADRREAALVRDRIPYRKVTLIGARDGSSFVHLFEDVGNMPSPSKQLFLAQLLKVDSETGVPLFYSETREKPTVGLNGVVQVPFVGDLNPELLRLVMDESNRATENARAMSLNKLLALKAAIASEEIKAGVVPVLDEVQGAARGASLVVPDANAQKTRSPKGGE